MYEEMTRDRILLGLWLSAIMLWLLALLADDAAAAVGCPQPGPDDGAEYESRCLEGDWPL